MTISNSDRTAVRAIEAPRKSFAPTAALVLIALAPFWATQPMINGVFGIDSLRLTNVVPIVAFFAFLAETDVFRPADRIERWASLAFAAYAAVFALAFLRSLPNLSHIHAVAPEIIPARTRTYIVGYFMEPLLSSMSFIYVLRTMRSSEALLRLFATMAVSLSVLACIVIVLVAADPSVLSTPNRSGITELSESQLGMHYNVIATFYVVTTPIFVFMAVKKGGWWTLNYILSIVVIILLESRTALALDIVMSVVTLLVMGRARLLLAALPVVAAAAALAVGRMLVGILSTGYSQRSGFSLDTFLTGRDQQIWLPLIFEWWSDPIRFWFGAGFLGILSSVMRLHGNMFAVAEAHSAYVEFFLDTGVVGLSLLLVALGILLFWAFRVGRKLKSGLYWALFLCVVSFLLSALTGRHFLPALDNRFVFPLVAALINVVRLLSDGAVQRNPAVRGAA